MADGVSAKGDFPICAGTAGGDTSTSQWTIRRPVTQATATAVIATTGGWSLPWGRTLWVIIFPR